MKAVWESLALASVKAAEETVSFSRESENITLTNTNTGELMNIEMALSDTDVVVVDTYNRTALLNGVTNVAEYITGYWLTLKPGINNLALTAETYTDETKVNITFREGYITI